MFWLVTWNVWQGVYSVPEVLAYVCVWVCTCVHVSLTSTPFYERKQIKIWNQILHFPITQLTFSHMYGSGKTAFPERFKRVSSESVQINYFNHTYNIIIPKDQCFQIPEVNCCYSSIFLRFVNYYVILCAIMAISYNFKIKVSLNNMLFSLCSGCRLQWKQTSIVNPSTWHGNADAIFGVLFKQNTASHAWKVTCEWILHWLSSIPTYVIIDQYLCKY